MSRPMVVQGTPVQPNFASSLDYGIEAGQPGRTPTNADTDHQPAKGGCKDPLFVILFYANFIGIAALAFTSDVFSSDSSAVYDTTTTTTESFEYQGYIYAALISAVLSLILSAGGLGILMCIPETILKISLLFSLLISFLIMAIAFATMNFFLGIIGLVFFAFGVCYARAVWHRYVLMN